MRASLFSIALLLGSASPAFAAEEAAAKTDLLSPHGGLMVWTLAIFILLFFILSRYAFGPITRAVEAREQALQDAIDQAKRDREEAARILAEHRTALEGARGEAQKLIAEARAAGERVRAELLEQAKGEQAQILERARREIGAERDRAILELRKEAVDLAIAGASKVVEQNLDSEGNRRLVESFLATVPVVKS